MFFFLSKVLLYLIFPLTWIAIALGLAFFAKGQKWRKRGRIAAIVTLLFFSNTFVFLEFMRAWEIHGTPVGQVKHHDVGIVLTGMAEYNNDIDVLSLRRSGDRIWQAITLYRKGKIDKILITGDHGYLVDKGLHEAEQLKDVLVSWGFPANDIITETKSKNTWENAVETKKLLTRSYPQHSSFLLITSGRHMRRARACFAKAGLKCDSYSTDLYTGPQRRFAFDEMVIPDAGTLSEWNGLLKEMFGYLAYKITGKA
jgi:uncharacterized SAM-binding protein YcdF (DUF218 family)